MAAHQGFSSLSQQTEPEPWPPRHPDISLKYISERLGALKEIAMGASGYMYEFEGLAYKQNATQENLTCFAQQATVLSEL